MAHGVHQRVPIMPIRALLRSTVGLKAIMAITGIVMVGFVVGHVLGNLLVFRGPAELNAYSAFLRGLGGALWAARAVLLLSVGLHVWAALALTRLAWKARPVAYTQHTPQVATIASRTIRWGGLILAGFIVFHILHLTTGTIRPAVFQHGDVYANVVSGFRVGWVAALYLVAMIALGLHLYHGAWSAVRTLGWNRITDDPLKRRAAAALAVAVWAGFSAIPIAVLLGVLE
jgi:succinate dehydrogenase / fumarate reductase, cytochrome b subunit